MIYNETISTIGLDYTYEYIVRCDKLPSEIQSSNANINFAIMIDQGRWEHLSIIIEVTYPIDVL